MKVLHVDAASGDTIEREMTADEAAQYKADQVAHAAAVETQRSDAAKRAAARKTLLNRLGMTEAEVELLLRA